MHNHKVAEYTLINPIITAFNHDSHAYANGSLMEHTMQLAYETVKYATGYVNDITPRGFADIHYDVETSDLSETNTDTEAFINGQTVSVAGQAPTDTLSIFANNLLTGKKATSNILVPVTGLVENVANKYAGSITDGIVNSISGAGSGIVSSQGQNIQSNNFTTQTSSSNNIGYAKVVPANNGTPSNPNNMSDTLKYFSSLVGSKK